jgi:putative inorganic carbon (HCO3(-)) transporter
MMSRALFSVLVALVFWLPWPMGSNRPWSWGLMEFFIFVLFGCICVLLASRSNRVLLPLGSRTALLCGLGACGWLLIQTLPLPTGLLMMLSPLAELHRLAPAGGTGTISVDIGATLSAFLKLSAYLALFALVLILAQSRRRVITLLAAIVSVAVLRVLYGIAVRFGGEHLGLWDPGFSQQAVSGTYVNRNHFAGLLILGLGICVGVGMSHGRVARWTQGWRAFADSAVRAALGVEIWLAFATVILLAGLMLSTSRGAAVGITGGVVLIAALSGHRTRLIQTGLVALALAVIAGVWLGTGEFFASFAEKGLHSNRLELALLTLELVSESPWVGGGGGTFEWRFPQVRSAALGNAYYHHAHNDYLELLSDLGVVGCLPFLVGFFVIARRIALGMSERRDGVARACLLGIAMALGSALMHAMVDFNFHIPANAAYFFVLAALGIVASDRRVMRHEN